jgi:uncharacterized delta-60 repeat protein
MNPSGHEMSKDYFWFESSPVHRYYGYVFPLDVGQYWWSDHPTLPIRAGLGEGNSTLTVQKNEITITDIDLSDFTEDKWKDLYHHGEQIPLRILVHEGKVAGQWLPDPGIPPPPPATARPDPAWNFLSPPPATASPAPAFSFLTKSWHEQPVAENLRKSGPAGSPQSAGASPEPAAAPRRRRRAAGERAAGRQAAAPRRRRAAGHRAARPEGGKLPFVSDASFGDDGSVLASFHGQPSDAQAMCVQPDGRLIVAGAIAPAGSASDIAVARFLPDGDLDEDFGDGGWAVIGIRGRNTVAYAVARQTDDKIVVAGKSHDVENNRRSFILVRLDADGQADATFGSKGYVETDFGGDSLANAVAIQKDGKIVAAGCARPDALPSAKPRGSRSNAQTDTPGDARYFALARYNKNGRLDARFGERGLVMTSFLGGDACAYALAVQPGGELVAAGVSRFFPTSSSDFACARYRADGRLDQNFGTYGWTYVSFTYDADDTARAVALQDDGKIVLAGTAADRSAEESRFALVRLDADGRPDTSFNGNNAVAISDIWGGANGVAIQADGAILAAGYNIDGERERFALARYRDDGSDPPWVSIMILIDGSPSDRANAIPVDTDGKIVLAGTSRRSETQKEFALCRVLPEAG